MQIGWIDFSKEERNKVLDVIDLLSEDGTLDELGIAPIRDGFANIFFPGTSTIQTRAKYFLIVPYALADLDHSTETKPQIILEKLSSIERTCGEKLIQKRNEGIIGARNLTIGMWVKRPPSAIYWAGIRKYAIFRGANMSIPDYVRATCAIKRQKITVRGFGNRQDGADENECDDTDTGALLHTAFWRLPFYERNTWLNNLSIELTIDEADFLKDQIIESCPDSMLAFILKYNLRYMPDLKNFNQLSDQIITQLPSKMQEDYHLAKLFSEFLYGARIRYNIMLSLGRNKHAVDEWERFVLGMAEKASLNLQAVFSRLNLRNPMLKKFTYEIQRHMTESHIDLLDDCIRKRECQLKGSSRAKLMHAGDYDPENWIGGGLLDYRFSSAMQIVKDIFDGEGGTCAKTDI